MHTITAEELHGLVARVMVSVGSDQANADRVADSLVSSDLADVETHGVFHLPLYVADIRAGYILPKEKPEIIKETPTSALVGGNWTFGFVSAKYAMDIVIRKAREQNVAVVGIVQANHIGRVGEYAEMAAAEGMICFVWGSGYSEERQSTVPYGGRKKVLHTNPLSMGFPVGDEPPMLLDFATTAVAGGKVALAREKNLQVVPGSIVDKDGKPTTNPDDFFDDGAHLPFGLHKGYGIMMAIEFLGRIFTGSDTYADPDRGGPYHRHQGITIMAMKADMFSPMDDYARRAAEMERRVRAVPPAPGFEEVLVPGDLEARRRAARTRDGIPIADEVWKILTDLVESLGVEV